MVKLRKVRLLQEDAFLSDPSIIDSAERNLQIAIQAVIDIGNHIAADMDLGTPRDYKEIFQLLIRNNVIPEPLGAKLISMTDLQNILVHDYLEIDLRLIYRIIQGELDVFDEFIAATLKLI